jgi:cyanophycinase-like exopeptidase
MITPPQPGPVLLFGSGETSANGQQAFDWLFRRLDQPPQVAILETPAGFELNSPQVARRIAKFLRQRLQNYAPAIALVPARRRGTAWSPDEPDVVAPLLRSNVMFLGPGSPSYAVRQLQDSLAWHTLRARQHLGAAVVLTSAAAIAAGAFALPVYEIYKVGEDLHWKPGLDLFADYGLKLAIVPHWNNNDGGAELDTSRCFMGLARFEALLTMLPAEAVVLGLDEQTALAIDWAAGIAHVLGQGGVTVLRGAATPVFGRGQSFSLTELGPYRLPEPGDSIPGPVWRQALAAAEARPATAEAPPEVLELVEQRQRARQHHDWAATDSLRDQIEGLGWQVQDTAEGPKVSQKTVHSEQSW